MIYLLGGPPRVGKSIISNEIRQKHAISVVSTDSLGAVLESTLSLEAAPDLFVFARFNEMPVADRIKLIVDDPAELVDSLIKESRVVWKGVSPSMILFDGFCPVIRTAVIALGNRFPEILLDNICFKAK